jgi:hypothetical protein
LNRLDDLQQKKILVIVPFYYEYHDHIRQCLQSLGAVVTMLDNKGFPNDPENRGTKWYSATTAEKQMYIASTLFPSCEHYFDICLFVNLFSFEPEMLKKLRAANPKINCILYLWDNIDGYKWENYLSLFDRVTFFSSDDAKHYGGNYLPNFFVDCHIKQTSNELAYDLMAVSSFQSHRNIILNKIAFTAKDKNKTVYFHLYKNGSLKRSKLISPPLGKAIRWLKGAEEDFIKNEKLAFHTVLSLMQKSKCVVDLPYPKQSGCTHRLIQALAMNKKVLTTNTGVTREQFYNNELIKVIDPQHAEHIDWDWVTESRGIGVNVDHLRIDRWLITLLT